MSRSAASAPFRLACVTMAMVIGLLLSQASPVSLASPARGCEVLALQDEPAEASADETQDEGSAELEWSTNVADAMERAKAENKDLVLNFTGSDWCGWCIKLDGEVFSKPEFASAVNDKFIFVKLDFPRDKSKVTEAEEKQNKEWQNKLEVSGFPSIYLVDADGRPYAKTGYREGGPEPYVAHLNELRDIRVKRDELLAQAATAEGSEKAKLLDEALSLIDEALITTHYEPLIKEIVALDKDDDAGLRTKYFAAQDARARQRILDSIALAKKLNPPQLALKEIDAALGEMKLPPMMRIDALQMKLEVLRRANDQEALQELLDEMISIEGIPAETKHRLVIQKIYTMVGAGEEQEAINLLDDMIASTIQNLQLCVARGELYDRLGNFEQAIEAYDTILNSDNDNYEIKAQVCMSKSDALAQLDKFDEAINVLDNFVNHVKTPDYVKSDVLIQKAMLLREMGNKDAAELAEYKAVELAESPEIREELLKIIEQLRKDF